MGPDLKEVRATWNCFCAYCTAQAIHVLKSCQGEHRAYNVKQKRRFSIPFPCHTPSEPQFLSFANVPTNNAWPFPEMKESTTDEINGFPGMSYFISYKSDMFLYPFSLFWFFFSATYIAVFVNGNVDLGLVVLVTTWAFYWTQTDL